MVIKYFNDEFRLIDTAGIRNTKDKIENIGIKKTYEKINHSSIVLFILDCADANADKIEASKEIINQYENLIQV